MSGSGNSWEHPNALRSEAMEEANTFFICLPEPLVTMTWKDHLATDLFASLPGPFSRDCHFCCL